MGLIHSMLGWENLDQQHYDLAKRYKRSIIIYPHTSRADFLLYLAYYEKYNLLQSRAKVLVNPKFMERWGFLADAFGGVASTDINVKGGNAVERICEELSKHEEFMFFISPKGCLEKRDWRSGYYHIARRMNCPIAVGGFDYNKKRFVVKEPFSVNDMTIEECQERCKRDFYDIAPHYPEASEFPIAAHDKPVDTSLLTTSQLITVIIVFIIVLVVLFLFIYWLTLVATVGSPQYSGSSSTDCSTSQVQSGTVNRTLSSSTQPLGYASIERPQSSSAPSAACSTSQVQSGTVSRTVSRTTSSTTQPLGC